MRQLTRQEKFLIDTLKALKLNEEETIGALALLKTPQMKDELLDWIAENQTATNQELMNKVGQIIKNSR